MASYLRRHRKAGVIGKTVLTGLVFAAGVLSQKSCDVAGDVEDWYGGLRQQVSAQELSSRLESLPDSVVYRLFRERFVDEVEYRR